MENLIDHVGCKYHAVIKFGEVDDFQYSEC